MLFKSVPFCLRGTRKYNFPLRKIRSAESSYLSRWGGDLSESRVLGRWSLEGRSLRALVDSDSTGPGVDHFFL